MCLKMLRLCAVALLALAVAQVSVALPKGFGRKKDTIPLLREDMKFIQCEMCEKVAKHTYRVVKDLRDKLPSWDKLSEDAILEHLESVCLPEKEGFGDWLTKLDIQEDGDRLRVVEMMSVGDCQRECMTMARICDDLIGNHDIELSELLYKTSTTRAQVTQALCYDMSSSCTKKPPPFKGPRKDGEEFVALDEDKLKLKRMIATMSEQGMSGNLFSRDSMLEHMEEYEDSLSDYGYDMNDLKQMAQGGKPSKLKAGDVGNDEGDEL